MTIVAVTSPVHGLGGNTTAAILTALSYAARGKSVCLTHLSAKSEAFFSYLGLSGVLDVTRSPTQAVNLLRSGVIAPDEFKNYCVSVGGINNLDVYSNNSNALVDDDMANAVRFVTEQQTHDVLVVDVDVNLQADAAKYVLEKANLKIICITQMDNVFWRYNEVFSEHAKKPEFVASSLFLCNHYTGEAGSIKAFAKKLGVSPSKCLTLRHSETLIARSNAGKIADIARLAKSIPLPDIDADLIRLGNKLCAERRKS